MIYDDFAEALIAANKIEDEWPILWGDRFSSYDGKDDHWLEMRWYPNGHDVVSLGKRQVIDVGFFRVRVCGRANHVQIRKLARKAELIRLSFPATTLLGCAYVDETPELSGLVTDDKEMTTCLTVTVRYTGRVVR